MQQVAIIGGCGAGKLQPPQAVQQFLAQFQSSSSSQLDG
ncbi:hypothetical protein AM1_1385 [Acaryochloris marina MBIC11017]|uniref:Uncharacterized protein n=1 Tax=Acaryochloris marina (strain MBIC 11017) TaxID=329726 RepID=B0C6J5_ACAM1|nr:hypothetical protein AM1_1385 [Acaryochloris marina MBIC11017]